MPNWVHRTDKTYLHSVPEDQLPESVANYIENPDLSAVAGQPSKYWTITGDVISLMSAGEQATVDAQELSDRRDATADQLDILEDIMRAFALVVLDELNTLRAQHSLADRTIAQLKTALRNKLGT